VTNRTNRTMPLEALIRSVCGAISPPPEGWAERERRVAAEIERENAVERAQAVIDRRRRLTDAGFPARALEVALASPRRTPALDAVRREPSVWCVVLSGGVGTGKTVAAAWWGAQVAGGRFATLPDLESRGRYDRAGLASVERARRLVLDDLGAEHLNDSSRCLVDGLLDARYRAGNPIVITTNLTARQFRARYGERIVDRIRDGGRFVQVSGNSMRGGR